MVEVCTIAFSELRIFKDLNSSQLNWVCRNSRNVAVCCEWGRIPEKGKPLEEGAVCKMLLETLSDETR